MSMDELSQTLWPDGVNEGNKSADKEDRLAEALQKALDKTTPERAGCPWDGEHKPNQYSDDDLDRDLIETARPRPFALRFIRRLGHYQDDS